MAIKLGIGSLWFKFLPFPLVFIRMQDTCQKKNIQRHKTNHPRVRTKHYFSFFLSLLFPPSLHLSLPSYCTNKEEATAVSVTPSASFSPSFRETDVANLFFGLRCVKPKKPASIFSLTGLHVRPEVLPHRRSPLAVLLRFRRTHAFFLHFYLIKGLLSKTQIANFLTVGSLFLHMSLIILKWDETGGDPLQQPVRSATTYTLHQEKNDESC